MSLFENNEYRWRETYFVMFREQDRPDIGSVSSAIESLGDRYQLDNLRGDASGLFETATVVSPSDFSAMDITYLEGDEVRANLIELIDELQNADLTDDDRAKVQQLHDCNARFEVYHFERLADDASDDAGFLDPGALLNVLEKLAAVCNGICVDPQAGSVI